jgi:glycosyltransferase involved in cell wall biosynthesis
MSFKFSIITINLNDKLGLSNTITSVIKQTYKNFEFIIIDGGSTDGSVDVINMYRNHIDYYVNERDNGIYNAMNKGIEKANGEYCMFLNSKDVLADSYVLERINVTNPTADIIIGDIIKIYNDKNVYVCYEHKISLYYLSFSTIWHQATFIKRNLFSSIGRYNELYKIASDWDFWLRAIILNRCSVKYLEFPFAIFDTTGIGSNVRFIQIAQKERKEIFLTHFSYYRYYHYKLLRWFEESLIMKAFRKSYRILVISKVI